MKRELIQFATKKLMNLNLVKGGRNGERPGVTTIKGSTIDLNP